MVTTNKFLTALKNEFNYTLTENGAVTHKTTNSALLDMFAFGGAYRTRSEEDVIALFREAYQEDQINALKCLFYLRDILQGQGERRFFRVCLRDLASNRGDKIVEALIEWIPELGRWDDLYCLIGTPAQDCALGLFRKQLAQDLTSTTPSLAAKWMASINTSSAETRRLGEITRNFMHLTRREYRHMLSSLRSKIKIVEKLMSENRWDEIKFDQVPSRAGIIYKNAFARRDIIKEQYKAFAFDGDTTVNAKTLYPYEVVNKATKHVNIWERWRKGSIDISDTDRAMINKYWDNLTDYFNGQKFNGIAVVDTSGSMTGTEASAPLNVAISIGMYCAEKCKGPFANHYISFSSRPQLIEIEGADFVDKVAKIYSTNLCENTNIEATFDLLLETAIKNKCSQEDLPQNIIIISDMEFDAAVSSFNTNTASKRQTLMESIAAKWEDSGYKMPHLIFWNVQARKNNVPMLGSGRISYVSGFSPAIFETILSGKTGYELMMEKLNSNRYSFVDAMLQ